VAQDVTTFINILSYKIIQKNTVSFITNKLEIEIDGFP
jgi:hypothetical protein